MPAATLVLFSFPLAAAFCFLHAHSPKHYRRAILQPLCPLPCTIHHVPRPDISSATTSSHHPFASCLLFLLQCTAHPKSRCMGCPEITLYGLSFSNASDSTPRAQESYQPATTVIEACPHLVAIRREASQHGYKSHENKEKRVGEGSKRRGRKGLVCSCK